MMIRSIGHAVLFSAITLGSITAVSAAPGNSAGGGNSGNGTIPGHSNGLGGGDGGGRSGGRPLVYSPVRAGIVGHPYRQSADGKEVEGEGQYHGFRERMKHQFEVGKEVCSVLQQFGINMRGYVTCETYLAVMLQRMLYVSRDNRHRRRYFS